MKPLKILFLTTFFFPDKFGGAERVVYELARNLAGLGQEITVVTHRAEGTREEEELAGFRVLRYPAALKGRTAFYTSVFRNARARIKSLVRSEGFHILHTHQLLSAFAAFFPTSLFKGREVTSFYAPYHQEFETKYLEGRPAGEGRAGLPLGAGLVSRLLRWGDRRVLQRAQATIVLSRFSRSQVKALLGRVPEELHIIPAGVDHERFKPLIEREKIRQELGVPEGTPLLFTVRRLVERMGLEDLIDAAGRMEKRDIPFLLAIGGEGPLRPALEKRAGSMSRVRFLGRIPEDDLPLWYGASDLFVLPTRSLEGFGMVTVEAMACGVPVAGTAAGATPELLGDLDKGLIFEINGPDAMAEKIMDLLKDPDRLKRLGMKARELVETRYLWPHVAERILEVYRRVLSKRGSPS